MLSSSTHLLSLSKKLPLSLSTKLPLSLSTKLLTTMQPHAFASNPLRAKTPKPADPFSPTSALETIKAHLLNNTNMPISPKFKVLPFTKGRPLAFTDNSSDDTNDDCVPNWRLGWISFEDCEALLAESGEPLSADALVYLGSRCQETENEVCWAVDVSGRDALVAVLGRKGLCFVELRTLMVATDWGDSRALGDLAIAGHGRSLIEWHSTSLFCGHCGEHTIPLEGGRRKQCSSESCKSRIYPRVDPVVIMLVIDKENDRALLSRQSRFVPRMWSCLAGFMEPGESLEEAVRRETWEETGIEVGEVIYHSSQPWPVGPSSLPCQLMVGFFAIAKSLEINVDKTELEDAQWHSREDVRKALTFAEYRKAQRTAAVKVDQMCKGVQKGQNLSTDFNVESGELAPMFIPGPFAIAHHLISSWVNQDQFNGVENRFGQTSSSLSSL